MRISDWSSDVCSSDLCPRTTQAGAATSPASRHPAIHPSTPAYASRYLPVIGDAHPRRRVLPWALPSPDIGRGLKRYCCISSAAFNVTPCATRSEEHTSELQSLMRISYAVFCLKTITNKTSVRQLQ